MWPYEPLKNRSGSTLSRCWIEYYSDVLFCLISASTSSFSSLASTPQSNLSLIDSLKLKPNEDIDVLPHEIFEKYIAYARRYKNSTR